MNLKSPKLIICLSLIIVTIVCFCLMRLSDVFAIIGSITMTICFSLLFWWSSLSYIIYKRRIEDKKVSDAYLYAEKLGDENAIKDFTYDRKTRRKLRYEKFNKFLIPASFFLLTICGIFLFLVCTRIIS